MYHLACHLFLPLSPPRFFELLKKQRAGEDQAEEDREAKSFFFWVGREERAKATYSRLGDPRSPFASSSDEEEEDRGTGRGT